MSSATQPFSPPARGALQAPRSNPALGEPSERGLGGAVHQQPSRKKHANRLCQVEDRKKEGGGRPAFLPIPSQPSGEGTESPNQAASTFRRGLSPTLTLPRGAPPSARAGASLGSSEEQLVWVMGCRSRSRGFSPPDSTPRSLSAWPLVSSSAALDWQAGWPPRAPAPPSG